MMVCKRAVPLDDISPEQAEIAHRVLIGCMAEVGRTPAAITATGIQRTYHDLSFQDPAFHKAREVAYRSAGIPFEWVDESPFEPRHAARGDQ